MRNFWYDIKAFMLLRKEVQRQKKTVEWQKFGLRHDWLYRIYTVVNPADQDKGDDEKMIQMKAFDKCTPMTKYIMSFGTTPTNSIGLSEVLTLSMEKIPETDSYLVVYYQIYYWFNPWRFWSRLILLLTAATLAIVYFF